MSAVVVVSNRRWVVPRCDGYHPQVREPGLGVHIDALGLAFSRGEADLAQVYKVHGSLVYGICRKTLSESGAVEVTQDVFVSAWKARDQFDPSRGSLSAWLVGIAKRRIIDHLRRERRHSDARADATESAPELDTDVERVADRMTVAHALSSLPERPRRAITLAYVHGLTHNEIAERTGLPLGTIKSDIRRGLLTLRDHLESSHE